MASANGLESFLMDKTYGRSSRFTDSIFGEEQSKAIGDEMKGMINGMYMAAMANMQRRSVVYRAKVTPELAQKIEDLLNEDPIEALLLLKSEAIEIALVKGLPNAEKFWGQIPNPDLDAMN